MTRIRVVVVGAGIVGAACARSLARAGARVTVIDQGPVGGGATAAGMGHLVVMDDSEAQFALTHYSQRLWSELSPRLSDDCEFDLTGTLWVATDDEEMEEVRRKHEYYATRGVPSEILDEKGLALVEPNLRPGCVGGLRVPGDRVLYPPCAARWLLGEAQSQGAEFLRGKAVAQLDGASVVFDDNSKVNADAIVVATGAAAVKLLPGLPIRPRKGHLVITDRYPGFVRHQLIELGYLKSAHGHAKESVAFNVQPRKTGQILLGSSRQFDAEHREVDAHLLRRMIARGVAYMPGLAKLSALRVWTGFRAATPDSLPLIGKMPGREGVFVAAGHEGLGITTSLGTAELVTASVLGRPSPIPCEPYLPSRPFGADVHG
jgi:glycine/D-amino acid oxidase-like deaminating enzyme